MVHDFRVLSMTLVGEEQGHKSGHAVFATTEACDLNWILGQHAVGARIYGHGGGHSCDSVVR